MKYGPKDINSSSPVFMKGLSSRSICIQNTVYLLGAPSHAGLALGPGIIKAQAQAQGLKALVASRLLPLFLLCVLTTISQTSNGADAIQVIW